MDVTGGLRAHLRDLLRGGQAFDRFEQIVSEVPRELRFTVPEGAERSAWQIVEHMRISLDDIVQFSDNADGGYQEREWPDEYWPKASDPGDPEAWDRSVQGFLSCRARLEALIDDPGRSLCANLSWGDGQTLLREALLAAAHSAYHCGELIVLTRWLKATA